MIPHKGARIGFQPRIRKGAFFEAAWRYGCRDFSVYNRTYISSTFSDPESEYWQVVEKVALWPAMGERQVEISGPDAGRFVQYLTPRDMSACAVGQCKYVLMTAPDGGILCDPIALRIEKDRYWLSTSDVDLELWAKGVAVNAGMRVSIRDAGVTVIQVQGPQSAALMAHLFGDDILDLKYYWAVQTPFQGRDLVISRTGWSGELGYEIYLSAHDQGDALFDALMEAGAPFEVAPGCVNQTRRIESGILSQGVDMTPEESPFDVGLGRLVQLDKVTDCIGREALLALSKKPPQRQLVGLTVDGQRLAGNETTWPLLRDGNPVGKLTSLAYSPRLERNLALGLVDAAQAGEGTAFQVETWDGVRKATVTALPFMPKRQASDPRAAVLAAQSRQAG